MVTILLERREFIRATHFTSANLFLGCSLAMAVGSKLWSESRRQFTSVDSSIVKGPIRLRDSSAKIWPPTRAPVRDCIRPYFSERPT